ncbi:class I SAM-dependent methyltransferase [Telmatospirillum sp. J64-1]|uniref:class I SAM-dependent methyltransferase n=1 Tax=Telmatospirillum sp. J64-1 TaxID=2502183 RepID=UPI00210556BB|nr:class I SAM-dependent methyltransferase [Telmatospirillum sp. J64-1]
MSPLEQHIRNRIKAEGPLPVSEFMAEALGHPEWGYYRKQDPLGARGDFTTAPEISQMFGELLGLWCAVVWQQMGSPRHFRLVELGPGRGTLMSDLLRAARLVPGFLGAVRVHLVETSPVLRLRQREALRGAPVDWHDDFSEIPDGPMLLVANEFFDALPIRQFVRDGGGWRERLIDACGDDLDFVTGPLLDAGSPGLPRLDGVAEGDIAETCPAGQEVAQAIGRRLCDQGGAALIVDYGHSRSAAGDTLQAVRQHRYHPVLALPGEADLTAHVDFQALADAARPAKAHGTVDQGSFLRAMGIEARAEALLRGAEPKQRFEIATACHRLISPTEMGTLFKSLALTQPDLPAPPGF